MNRSATECVCRLVRTLGAGLLAALMGSGALSPWATAAESSTPPELIDGYLKLGFSRLASFPFTPPPFAGEGRRADLAAIEDQIPPAVKAWSGRKAAVTGYMLPLKSKRGLVTELVLTQYTVAKGNTNDPTINEWIIVKVPAGLPAQTLLPITFFGVLKVGAVFERGYLVAIYEFTAERVSPQYLLE